MKYRAAMFVLCTSLIQGAAMAAITPVGPFTGAFSEDFESYLTSSGTYPGTLFGGQVGLSVLNDEGQYGGIKSFGQWGLNDVNGNWTNVIPSDGNQFMTGTGWPETNPMATIRLDLTGLGPVNQFGGYFADIVGGTWSQYFGSPEEAHTFIDFYGDDGMGGEVLLYSTSNSTISTAGELTWIGYQTTEVITSVEITGWETAIDGLQVNPVPEPGTMAVLGLGALAAMRRRRNA